MRALRRLAVPLVLLACVATFGRSPSADADPGTPSTEAVAALTEGNCNLCHAVPGVPAASRDESCTACHLWIRSTAADPARRAKAMEFFPLWERYEHNVASYLAVPSLDAAMVRLEPAWVASWLADPHDIRPNLDEGMPAFALSKTAIEAIAAEFGRRQVPVPKTSKPSKKNIDAGRARFLTSGCAACHGFGADVLPAPGIPGAPDLAHTRARMAPDRVVAWIQDPRSIAPSATMPSFGIKAEDAVLIRDYLFLADPGWIEPAAVSPPPEPTTTAVSWDQVEARVFGKICAHCHMDPSLPQNQGRRGPGNAGGFGYPETGIALQSPAQICAVGDRVGPALLQRREEARRDQVRPGEKPISLTRDPKPGMPLGLPPLPDEDIALVLGWIQQGCPE